MARHMIRVDGLVPLMMKEGLQATRHPLFKDMDWSYLGVQGLYVLEVVEWSDADMVRSISYS